MEKIKTYIYEQVIKKSLSTNDASIMLKEIYGNTIENTDDIAIIGMDCRLPGAKNVCEYWENLKNGENCIGTFPEDRRKNTDAFINSSDKLAEDDYLTQGYLEEVDSFDAAFFNISPAEAVRMDPIQRLLLQTAWGAIEDAGLGGNRLNGTKTGVYVGKAHLNEPLYKDFISDFDMVGFTGSATGILASRISYILNLNGPSLVVDTACSSGLVALHIACKALKNSECEQAIVGGARVMYFPSKDKKLHVLESDDNTLRPFDRDANGTVWGEGITAIIIKPLSKALSDKDNIYAVIKGSACNNDGASNGISAPNAKAQEDLIAGVWEKAGINPETISFIEAHGTGTVLGDPIEIKGITNAFKRYTDKTQFCGLGTVKGNIGHLVAPSGLAGLIKVVLCLKNKQVPPTINFKRPNPYINFIESPVYLVDKTVHLENSSYPLRAGVSSFGISGTNTHVIVEEAPVFTDAPGLNRDKHYAFTLSTRKGSVLEDLLIEYKEFFDKATIGSLENICYTANTGRGHYNVRLALVPKDYEDLKHKIQVLCSDGMKENPEEGVFFGSHKVVEGITASEMEDGMLTKDEKRKLDMLAGLKSAEYVKHHNPEELNELCAMYIQGADIPWSSIYAEEEVHRVSLPIYPFEKKRYWPQSDNKSEIPIRGERTRESHHVSGEKTLHPLLEKLHLESMNQKVFTTEFSADKHWVLKEHKVTGKHVMPGVAYLEIALQAGMHHFGTKSLRLNDIVILSPLMLEEGETRTVQTIIKEVEEHLEFEMISRGGAHNENVQRNWEGHVQGKIYKNGDNRPPRVDVTQILRELDSDARMIDPNAITKGFIHFGDRWTNCLKLTSSDKEALAELTLDKKYQDDLSTYYLQPALLDMAVNALSLTVKERYLPLAYKNIMIYGSTPSRFYSHIKMKDIVTDTRELIQFDILLLDTEGNVFAEIYDYTIKKVDLSSSLIGKNNLYHSIKWIPVDIASHEAVPLFGGVIIFEDPFGSGENLAVALRNKGCRVIQIRLGSEFKKVSDGKYIISGEEEDYFTVLGKINLMDYTYIVNTTCMNSGQGTSDLHELDAELNKGVYSLFFIIKSILKRPLGEKLHIFVITQNAEEVSGNEEYLQPGQATLFGLSRTLSSEYSNLVCRCIDIEAETKAEEIIYAMQHPGDDSVTAHRNGRWYVEELDYLDIEVVDEHDFTFKSEGVYIISGGTGDIGLKICKYLSSKVNATIALINRSILPDVERWDEIIEKNENRKLCNILQSIIDIRSSGTQVLCYSADVSKMEEAGTVIKNLKREYGRINGIIHCAGVAGDGFIINKEREKFDSVLIPKVYGAWVLDYLTRDEDMDFFALFSSIASFMGYPGQGDYSAANSYLDAFSAFRSKQGKRTLTINWPLWKDTGMGAGLEENIGMLFKPLQNIIAMNAFDKILHKNINRVIIGELDYDSDDLNKLSLRVSGGIRTKAQLNKKYKKIESKTDFKLTEVLAKGRKDGQYTETELKIARIWGSVLGLEEIDIFDSFYELGGDSVFAMKMVNSLNKYLNRSISISDVFNYQTVAQLAGYLDKSAQAGAALENDCISPIKPAEEKEYYPISAQQRGIFTLLMRMPENLSYNIPMIMEIEGDVDKQYFEEIMNQLVRRHEVLRHSFLMHEGIPVQRIHDDIKFEIKYSEAAGSDLNQLVNEFIRPFDLKRPPLLRAEIIKTGYDKFVFMLDVHHIIADRSSVGILIEDFFKIYQGVELPEILIQYKDYSEWQSDLYHSEKIKRVEEYWLNIFKEEVPLLNIPVDYNRASTLSYEGDSINFSLSENLCDALYKIASDIGTTINMVLTAAFYILLHKLTAQEDIIIGCNVLGRTHADIQNTMGMYVNTIPVRSFIKANQIFKTYLIEIQNSCLSAYDNQNYPFDNLLEKLNVKRLQNRNPLFDVCFNMMNISDGIDSTKEITIRNLVIKPLEFENKTAKFDITLNAALSDNRIEMFMEYKTCLFKRSTIQGFIKYYIEILETIAGNIHVNINEISLIDEIVVIKKEMEEDEDFILD